MSGRKTLKSRLAQWVARRNFSLIILVSSLSLPILIGIGVFDFVRTAITKDELAQSASIKSELAQFVLGIREDDGYPLLDNPSVLSRATRPLTVLALQRPFFTYFLQRANAKSFETEKVKWEMPKACEISFSFSANARVTSRSSLRVCAAYVKNDAMGRFVYFALRYPSTEIIRHRQGSSFSDSHHVRLSFVTEKQTKVDLVFEPATLASERYPSQKERFSRIHEITGYYADAPNKPLRSVNGQAYEQSFEDETGAVSSYVTLIGRIDASQLTSFPEEYVGSGRSRPIRVGVTLFDIDPYTGKSKLTFDVLPGATGQSAISFEQLYRDKIESRATLDITESLPSSSGRPIHVWSSKEISTTKMTAGPGVIQRTSDWWATKIVELFSFKKASQETKIDVQGREVSFVLREERLALPDIATRALLFLSIAFVIVIAVSAVWIKVMFRMRRIARTAYGMTVHPTSMQSLHQRKKKGQALGEIETLGRTLDLLMRKARSRNSNLLKRIERTDIESKLAEEHVKSRQSILDAIGHEIRSPLQSLISKTAGTPFLHKDIERMRRAVEALDIATSVEAGIKNSSIVLHQEDMASYLSTYAKNVSLGPGEVIYEGPSDSIEVLFDVITMEQILDHLLDNARRHRIINTPVVISLSADDATVTITVSNQGVTIPEDMLEPIFNYGVSSDTSDRNFGLGLFVVRVYLLAMDGTIFARNEKSGVSFVATFERRHPKR